jgi:flavodoxin
MKSVVIYYSFSGNTQKVAGILGGYLRDQSEVEILELKARDESLKFLGQCARAFRHKRADLELVNSDLNKYDFICLGTPVWAFGPAPAMNAYLDKCTGISGKRVILFTTYGSGTGKNKCLDYMQGILTQKGAKDFRRFSIQQFKAKDKEFVLSEIARLWPNG